MENYEEIKKSIIDDFDKVLSAWKTQVDIDSNKKYFTFFPIPTLFELQYPIYEETEAEVKIIDWVVYSFIDDSIKKADKTPKEYINGGSSSKYTLDNYKELVEELATIKDHIKSLKGLNYYSDEFQKELDKLTVEQVAFVGKLRQLAIKFSNTNDLKSEEKNEKDSKETTNNNETGSEVATVEIETTTENVDTVVDKETEDPIKKLVKELEPYLVDKKKYNFEINNVINKLNYVSDKALELAISFVKNGKLTLEREKSPKGNGKIIIKNYLKSVCNDAKENGYKEDKFLEMMKNDNSLVEGEESIFCTSDTSVAYNRFNGWVCEGCSLEKCPKAIAALIVYYLNTGELENVLRQRKEFRESNKDISPYFDFVWTNPNGVKQITDEDYTFCKKIVEAGFIKVNNVIGKDNRMIFASKFTCKEFAVLNNNVNDIPSYEDYKNRGEVTIERKTNDDCSFCAPYTCNLKICPFSVSAYIYYMKKIGKENELEKDRIYYHDNKDEIDRLIEENVKKTKDDIEKRKRTKLEDFQENERKIENIESVLDMIVNRHQKNLHIAIVGEEEKDRDSLIRKIAKVLKNENKIKGVRYYSFQQFSRLYAHTESDIIEDEKSIEKRKKAKQDNNELPKPYAKCDKNGVKYCGNDLTFFAAPENNYLYVLNNISEFVDDYTRIKKEKSVFFYRKALSHTIEIITELLEDNYFILTGNESEIEALLQIDTRLNFVYSDNILKIPDMTLKEMFSEYVKNLDASLLDTYRENEQKIKNEFDEYVSFARKFMPFNDKGLINYLASYANQRGNIEFPQNAYKKETLDESLKNIIGLANVKKKVKEFEKYMMFQIRAKANDIKIKASNMHMTFTGNPGTGKTTVARIMAKMLYDLGLIEENKLIEVERKDLIAEYIGQTAAKTTEVVEKAMGGVLFVDEAYTLAAKKGSNDFGPEAIATLIKAMEDHKDKLVVIFAGYREEMKNFLDTNPGISSRIGYTFDFEDYNTEELMEIFKLKSKNMGFKVADDVDVDLKRVCDFFSKRKAFGNGRFVDKLLQEAIMRHSLRDDLEDISLITKEDIPTIEQLNNANEVKTAKSAKEQLTKLIGLEQVKQQMNDFESYVRFVKEAEESGLSIPSSNLHMVFAGNPGTGKTTVARIIAQLLYEIGVIHENKLIEVERKDLVAEYVGQTASKTSEVIERAMGGVLFIDEAYTLANGHGSGHDYGAEAVATLIKAMEDHKNDLVVVFAGYTKEMGDFLNVNPGIASRIGYTFTFEDYKPDELMKIFDYKVEKSGMKLDDGARESLIKIMKYFHSVEDFGNGRFVDKVFARVLLNHAKNENRIIDTIVDSEIPTIKDITSTMLNGNSMVDVEQITEESQRRTALHEAGHAGVRYLLKGDPQIVLITINAEGRGTLGYVRPKAVTEDDVLDKKYFTDQIMISCAGRVAEEIFFGNFDTGWRGDLGRISDITERMITKYGMSDLGIAQIANPGAELQRMIYEEKNRIIEECLEKTRRLMVENKKRFQDVADYLMIHKEMNEEEFRREFDKSKKE